MFPVKNLEKKCEIIRSGRTQSKIVDRRNLLFQSGTQRLFIESLVAAKFDDARPLRAFFLLFHDRLARLLPFFRALHIDCALRRDFRCKGHAAETEKDPISHVSGTESDTLLSRDSRPQLRHRQRGQLDR